MLPAEEVAELRILHARAYGRDGDLSSTDAARLRDLESRRRGVPDPSTGSGSGAGSGRGRDSGSGDGSRSGDGSGSGSEESAAEPVEASGASRHPRLRWLIAGVAASVAIGIGVGWSVWGQSHDAIALTDEQRGWQEDLAAAATYDPGSLYAVSEDSGVVVWLATKEDGEKTCLLMSNGRETTARCQPTNGARADGMWAELQVAADDSYTDVTTAQVLFSAGGHPAVATDQYRNSVNVIPAFEPEEQKVADILIDRGYEQSGLWIVGYFDERPVWTGGYTEAEEEQCLAYVGASGAIEEDCGTWEEIVDEPLALTISSDGAGSRAAELVYTSSMSGPPYLNITVLQGSDSSFDAETGDPIEFSFDDPTFDDLVTDDETVQTGE